MTFKTKLAFIILSMLGYSLVLVPVATHAQAANVGASVNATVTTPAGGAKVEMSAAAMAQAKARADKELDRRIQALTDVNTRVQAMQKVTATFKQNLATALQTQLTAFAALKAKIDAGTDPAVLKTDVQSITQSYRVYALVLPQVHIAAAADRAVTISTMMQTLGTKLAARIQAAGNAGADISALTTALNDLGAKISDASTQAQTAVQVSAALAPDNGDKDKMSSNKAAMQSARTNLQTAQKDLVAARKDIDSIIKGLKTVEVRANATSTASTSAQ
jgi:hypothetical protein